MQDVLVSAALLGTVGAYDKPLDPSITIKSAPAGEIYRCGKVYQQKPCEGGKLIETGSAVEGYRTLKVIKPVEAPSSGVALIGGTSFGNSSNNAPCNYLGSVSKQVDRDAGDPRYPSKGGSLQQRRNSIRKQSEHYLCNGLSSR